MARNTVQLIHAGGEKVDYGTPAKIVDAARRVMGGIDLDPASAPYWNRRIGARVYWHIETVTRWYQPRVHPLDRPWRVDGMPARVWMNHPYGRRENAAWVAKLVDEYERGNVYEACALTFAEQSTSWGQQLRQFPRWIPDKRVAHMDRNYQPISGSVKGSMVTYLGPAWERFALEFSELGGTVDIPAHMVFRQREFDAQFQSLSNITADRGQLSYGGF